MMKDLQSRLASLNNEQIAFEIQRLAAALGDGHTVVYPIPTPRVRFSQLPIELYWMQALPDLEAVYVQFNQVRDKKPGPTMVQFAASLKQAIDRDKPKNLIVDLRLNNGGKGSGWRPPGPFRLWPMVRPLVYFEMLTEGNRLFVVTGRNTFSSAQTYLNHVEAATNAVIVGEPSSSRPNSVGGETVTVLPWSGLQMSIANRFWQDSFPGDHRPWIPPHIPVTLSSEDYFANHDPVMATLEEVIRGGVR